jgi:hypothetical protein
LELPPPLWNSAILKPSCSALAINLGERGRVG